MNRKLRVPRVCAFFAFLGFLLLPAIAAAQSTADCSVIQSKILSRQVPYCVILPPSFKNEPSRHYPVVYYLHGLGDNEQSLINLGGWNVYDSLLKQKKVGEFVMAAPMGYRSFFINSRDGRDRYEDFFYKEFVPAVERKYRAGGSRSERALVGISMGGFGALHHAFERPAMYTAVVGIMPALFEKLPESYGNEMEEKMLTSVFGNASHPEYFQKVSVFALASQRPAAELKRLKIAFNAGSSDDYGFYDGVTALDKLLTKRGIPHESHIYPGRHNASYALAHFGEALEFLSGAMIPTSADHPTHAQSHR